MIARILGEAQYEIPDQHVEELDELDAHLQVAVESDDQAAFATALPALLQAVRRLGTPLPDSTLKPSELVIPDQDMDLPQVRALLADEGLIPGWR